MSETNQAGGYGSSLGIRAVRGVAWTLVAQMVVNVFRLGGNLIAARFLDPEAYGLMAIVAAVNVGLAMISDVGIEQSVIFDDEGDDETFLSTAFALQLVRGLGLYAIALALTYPIATLYAEPRFHYLIPVASLQTLFGGLQSMRNNWNKRRVRQMRELALVEIGGQALAFASVVGLAWSLRSVWALAIAAAAGALGRTLLSHLLLDGPPDRLAWDPALVRRIVGYGRWIFVSTLVTYFSLRFDVFALGKLAGMSSLGLYNMALMLSSAVNIIGLQVVQSVLFPALTESSRTRDPEITRRTFERGRKIVLPVGLWAVTALAFLGPAFFHFAYRPEFQKAGDILLLQLPFVWFVFLTDAWTRALMAANDNRSMALANLIRLVGTMTLAPLGYLVSGIPGFLLGMGLASLLAHGYVHRALTRHGLPALRLDALYTLLGALLLGLASFGPDVLSALTGLHPMTCALILSFVVGLPFTGGLVVHLKQNVRTAERAAVA